MGPFLPCQVCRPVSHEQSREESGLARPGDGWKLLLGRPSHQQEQGMCHHRLPSEGAPQPGSAGRVQWEGADPGQHLPLRCTLPPRPHPLAQDRQAGSRALWAGGLARVTRCFGPPIPSSLTPSTPVPADLGASVTNLLRPHHLLPGETGHSALSHGQALPGGPARLALRSHAPRSSGPPCRRQLRPGSTSQFTSHIQGPAVAEILPPSGSGTPSALLARAPNSSEALENTRLFLWNPGQNALKMEGSLEFADCNV